MKIGLLGGVLIGGLITFGLVENKAPGSTAPVAADTRTAANNWMVTLGGMASDAAHVIIPVASDAIDTARTQFPNVLGPTPSTVPGGGAPAQHPPAAPQP